MDSVKMLDHMIELNSPTPRIVHIAVDPLEKMLNKIKPPLIKANMDNVRAGAAFPIKKPSKLIPMKIRKVEISAKLRLTIKKINRNTAAAVITMYKTFLAFASS